MRLFLLISIASILAAAQIPALAVWTLDQAPAEQPVQAVVAAPAANPQWTGAVSGQAPIVEPVAVTTAAPAEPVYVRIATPEIRNREYAKTDQDMRILNTIVYNNSKLGAQMVPEPGALALLPAGITGLLYGMRRARRR